MQRASRVDVPPRDQFDYWITACTVHTYAVHTVHTGLGEAGKVRTRRDHHLYGWMDVCMYVGVYEREREREDMYILLYIYVCMYACIIYIVLYCTHTAEEEGSQQQEGQGRKDGRKEGRSSPWLRKEGE